MIKKNKLSLPQKMMKIFLYLSMFVFGLWSCANSAPEAETAEVVEEAGDGLHFGETITPDGSVAYETLVEMMQQAETAELKVRAKVASVCQTKGCWMTVQSDNPEVKEVMFVQFEDYGFFMPFDLAGKEVVMLGQAYREVTSVDDLRHYAEDEGKSEEEIAAITEPLSELKFMAKGVVIVE
jgi:hypothetical protein